VVLNGTFPHYIMVAVNSKNFLRFFIAFLKVEFKKNFSNSICVDWQSLASPNRTNLPAPLSGTSSYLFAPAVAVTYKVAGERISEFIIFLKEQNYLKSYDDVHLIGHTLGAHVAGVAAYLIKQKTGEMIGRITGLNPLGPNTFIPI